MFNYDRVIAQDWFNEQGILYPNLSDILKTAEQKVLIIGAMTFILCYRFYSPKSLPGAAMYLDLLAHPSGSDISEAMVRNLMGVGDIFSFGAIEFALQNCFEVDHPIYFPNPLGFIALKAKSYLDAPEKRTRDFADIVELIWGMVEMSLHFQLKSLWEGVCESEGATFVRKTLNDIANDTGDEFDLYQIENELVKRGFVASDLEEIIHRRFKEFCQQVFG